MHYYLFALYAMVHTMVSTAAAEFVSTALREVIVGFLLFGTGHCPFLTPYTCQISL